MARLTVNERLLACRVAWMREYRGDVVADPPFAGGRYARENVVSGEVINFKPIKGRYFGYVQAPRGPKAKGYGRLDLAKHFGTSKAAEYADRVTVVWFASDPRGGGQKVVGIYRNARVLATARDSPPVRHVVYEGKTFSIPHNIEAAEDDVLLIPAEERRFVLPRVAGAPGQSNASYLDADAPPTASFRRSLLAYATSCFDGVDSSEEDVKRLTRGRGQGTNLSADERMAVALRAVEAALAHYQKRGWNVDGEYRLTGPYDLLFRKAGTELFVEVKGTTGRLDSVIVTRGEVLHARRNRCALVVVHGIQLDREATTSRASRGVVHVSDPWIPADSNLTPIAYRYLIQRE